MVAAVLAKTVRRGGVGTIRAFVRRHPTIVAGGLMLAIFIAVAVLAPLLGTVDPSAVAPSKRLRPPSGANRLARARPAKKPTTPRPSTRRSRTEGVIASLHSGRVHGG